MLGIVETKPIKGQYGIMTAGLVLTIHQPQRMEMVSPFSRRRVVESERQGAGSRESEPDKTNRKMIENIKQTGRANGAIALLMILAVCPRAAGQADEPAARESTMTVPRAPVAVHPDDKSSSADPRSWFDRWQHRGQTSGVTAGGPSHEANPAPLLVLPRSDQSALRAQKVPQDAASNPAPSAPDVGISTEPDLGVPANERRLGGGEATEAAAEATAEEPPATVTTLLMRALRMEDSPVKIYGYPFRHVGVVTTWHLTDRINLYNGTINGWDRWIDERYIWGYTGGFAWTSRDAKTNVAFTCVTGPNQFPRFLPANQPIYPAGYINIPALAGQNNPGYARNARTLFTTVITHKWTDKLTQVILTDQGWELNVPGLASAGANGAPRTAEWFSFGNCPIMMSPTAIGLDVVPTESRVPPCVTDGAKCPRATPSSMARKIQSVRNLSTNDRRPPAFG